MPVANVRPLTFWLGVAGLLGVLVVAALSTGLVSIQWMPGAPSEGYGYRPAAAGPAPYFPDALKRLAYKCRQFPTAVPVLSTHEVDWFGSHLRAAGERSLLPVLGRSERAAYRLLRLPSFEPTEIVRIEEEPAGRLVITRIRLTGAGGYEPGVVASRAERRLSAAEAMRFERAIHAAQDLKVQPVVCRPYKIYDGEEWVFEARRDGDYRYANREADDEGPLRALGLVMLELAQAPQPTR